MKFNGFTPEVLKVVGMSMPLIMGINYVATILAAYCTAMFLDFVDCFDSGLGNFVGVIIVFFWIVTNRLNDVLYEQNFLDCFF